MPTMSQTAPVAPAFLTVQDRAQLLAASKKAHLLEWKLSQYNGDPFQWHEGFGQFESAIDSATLTDDVKLTYLETLVTGKTKAAIQSLRILSLCTKTFHERWSGTLAKHTLW